MIFNYPPELNENYLPPDQVNFVEMRPEPWPDGQRIRVHVEVTPFRERPNFEFHILDPAGENVAEVKIIESMTHKLAFTMHLRGQHSGGVYTLVGRLYYQEEEDGKHIQAAFELPATPGQPA